MLRMFCSLFAILLGVHSLSAQELVEVGGVEWPALRDHVRELLRSLEAAKAPLSEATARPLRHLLDRDPANEAEAVAAVQKLLDPHCLVGVTINPESRVKAARGPQSSQLQQGTGRVVLIRVHNDGGVTSTLAVSGPGIRAANKDEGWLRAAAITRARLSGRRLEYVAVRLTALEGGKREATFVFDVGQGTQDLGFRAEVPILFTVRNP